MQLYIFQDRVEIVTPGGLPAGMSEADLGSKSVPRNPLLFSILYRMRLVQQIGSGIRRMIDACAEHSVESPEMQVSDDWFTISFRRLARPPPPVAPQVRRLIDSLQGEMSRAELMAKLKLSDLRHFREGYIRPALETRLIEMTMPDRPSSRLQRHRLTELGIRARDTD